MKNYNILIGRLDFFINVKSEIDRILYKYEENIKEIIENIRVNRNKDGVYTLFAIHNKLSIVYYKYEYDVSRFLSDFIYEFDRQDEESVDHLFNEIIGNNNFLGAK